MRFQSLSRDSGCSSGDHGSGSSWRRMFQSLSRDSGCSSKPSATSERSRHWFQSLSRDSGCSSLGPVGRGAGRGIVSIPQSGFWVFKRATQRGHTPEHSGFNPSVGILGVQARFVSARSPYSALFQSLSRDSGCSSSRVKSPYLYKFLVSIPQSGFWVFKPTTACACPG